MSNHGQHRKWHLQSRWFWRGKMFAFFLSHFLCISVMITSWLGFLRKHLEALLLQRHNEEHFHGRWKVFVNPHPATVGLLLHLNSTRCWLEDDVYFLFFCAVFISVFCLSFFLSGLWLWSKTIIRHLFSSGIYLSTPTVCLFSDVMAKIRSSLLIEYWTKHNESKDF